MAIIKHKEQRVGVFIDTQNLYHSAKNLYQRKVNFGKVVEDAVGGRSLIRALAYVITSESGEEQNFFDALTKTGIETKTKDLIIFSSGSKKGDWDVGLAVDAITMAPKLDTVILITGDGDFKPLIEYLQTNQGCQVEVISFGRSSSHLVKEAADDFVDLDKEPHKYLIGYRQQKSRPVKKQQPEQRKQQNRQQKSRPVKKITKKVENQIIREPKEDAAK